ncbi:MAG TPA: Hpt domain-containing protein, partial [Rhodanobacter sp.]|nr:Hpt domain-containing protein [Rhodanobacter sp.]
DDLLRVKEALDLFQRQPGADPASLAPQCDVLARLGDTLGMLALAVPRRVVEEQRRVLDDLVNHQRPADESTLLDVAGALLYVEASLDDHIESLGADDGVPGGEGPSGLPRSEAQGVIATVMQEAIRNIEKVKEAIVGFVESGWDHAGLTAAPALMAEVAGAARMLSAERPAELADGVGRFIHNELLVDQRVPGSAQMDHLADALAALEYYLEAVREHRGGLAHIVDVAEHSLGELGYWPLSSARPLQAVPVPVPEPAAAAAPAPDAAVNDVPLSETVSLYPGSDAADLLAVPETPSPMPTHDVDGLRYAETVADMVPAAVAAGDDADWIEIEEEVEEQVPVAGAPGNAFRFDQSAEDIDDDIREIFLEEMQEEIDNLRAGVGAWLAEPERLDTLTPIRRSFHTLKGSGRLVGIAALGEFAWRVEDMLNRVLDHTIEPHSGVQALVQHAIAALPQLLASLKGEGAPTAPIDAIMQTASKLAAGAAAARIEDCPPPMLETVRRKVRRRVPRAAAAAIPTAAVTDAQSAAAAVPAAPAEMLPVSPLPAVDPVLLEILRSEVGQYLQAIRAALAGQAGELTVDEPLLRAVHTMHGAIAMVDIPFLTRLLSPSESLLKRLRAADLPLPPEGVALLARAADAVEQTLAQFDAAVPALPEVDALAAEVAALRDRYPEAKAPHFAVEPPAGDAETQVPDHAAEDATPPPPVVPERLPESAEHDDYTRELIAALGAFEPDAPAPIEPATTEPAAQSAGAEPAAAERAAAEQAAAERAETERVAAEQAEAERLAAEQAQAEQEAAEREAAERREAERAQAEQERARQAQLAEERAAREAAELQMRAAAEQAAAEQARRAAEQAAATD